MMIIYIWNEKFTNIYDVAVYFSNACGAGEARRFY